MKSPIAISTAVLTSVETSLAIVHPRNYSPKYPVLTSESLHDLLTREKG